MRDSNSRGVAPNTLSKHAPQCSRQAGTFVTWNSRNWRIREDACELRRMRLRMRLRLKRRTDSGQPDPRTLSCYA